MKYIYTFFSVLIILSTVTMAFRWMQLPPEACNNTLFTYGIIADCQYCDCTNGTFGYSIPKLQEAVDTFNARKVSHTLHLGDFIQQNFSSYDSVAPVYSSLDSAHYYTLGNHEFDVMPEEKPMIISRLGMSDYYYDFTKYNWRFIVLESTELAFYSEEAHPEKVAERDAMWAQISGQPNSRPNSGGMSQEQLIWLDNTLTDAESKGQKAVLFSHHPVWPINFAAVWNSQDVIDIIESHNNVVAYMNGHNHAGDYAIKNGVHYVTFQAMVLTPDENSFSLVEVFRDRLEVNGYGRQDDFTLPFSSDNQAPQDILLDNSTIDELLPTGTLVGNLDALDADYADYTEIQFVTGAGDEHNLYFYIQNNQLFTNASLDANDGPFSIRLQAMDCSGATFEKNFSITVNSTCVTMDFYVYMEGVYSTVTQRMNTHLNLTRRLLPGQTPASALATPTPVGQPYAQPPWDYDGNEGINFGDNDYPTNVVDWVLVSLRTSTSPDSEVAKFAGLLSRDGHIDLLGNCLRLSEGESYYIVVEHRNHLPVMSHIPIEVSNRSLNYDFRTQNSYNTQASFGSKEVQPNIWAMYGGNVLTNADDFGYQINGDDKILWFEENGTFDQYTPSDINLDGDINGADKSIWVENNGISSGVPR